jgi:hypothetical protein
LQTRVADPALGRAAALDVAAQSMGQCVGGVAAALVLSACVATAPRPPRVDDRLAALAVSDRDFYRPVLYTWTTPENVAALRESHQLLVATAATGGKPSPFNRALAQSARGRGRGKAIAALLTTHDALVRRRYAWPAPFATVLGLGDKGYGNALVRIELRPDAWIARYDPTSPDPFRVVDARGAPVALDAVLAEPERLGAVFHVRTDRGTPIKFREYVVTSEAMVASWSVATPAIRAELDAELALLRDLRATAAMRPRTDTAWRAALAFYNDRYAPTPEHLDAIVAALLAYDPAGAPLTVTTR